MTTETTANVDGQTTTGAGDQTQTTAGNTATGDNTQGQGQQTTDQGQNAQDQGTKVPEAYEFNMPEGLTLEKAAADEFSVIAKELKLTQESASKIAEVGAKMAQRQLEKHNEMVQSWVESAKIDKDFGGDKFEENLATARKVVETFGSPELKDVLNASGLGNHPAILKAFLKIGKSISQDTIVRGGTTSGSVDPAKKMFPNQN